MNGQKPNVFMPALVGGAVAGILSGIPVLNCLCCLWIIGGAILASYLAAKDSPVSLKAGDGAVIGAFTGIFAALIRVFLSIPFRAVEFALFQKIMERLSEFVPEATSEWKDIFSLGAGPISMAGLLLGLVLSAAIFAVLGALGGIIGMALFGKKTPSPGQGTKNETPQDAGHRQS
jgi:uncharacterized protein YqgC (DUF456 family)